MDPNGFITGILFVLLILFAGLIMVFATWVRRGHAPQLRPIPTFDALQTVMARAIEAGRKLHLSLGIGNMAAPTSADSLAGLTVLDYVAEQTTAAGVPPVVTMADPTVMLLAQERLRDAYGANQAGITQASAQVQWFSPEPAAYAAGVMGIIDREDLAGNVLVGNFGDEYLLVGETAAQKSDVPLVAGASSPNVIPYVYATTQSGLWGEELYVGGAYLSKKPAHIGSVLAQDTIRWIIGLVILGGVFLKIIGVGS